MARTRSEGAHQKVLDAAIALVAERGVEGTSMDAISEQSGVSKATIYKHWADKDALLLEIMAVVNGLQTRPKFDSGHTRLDMLAVLSYRPQDNAEMRERLLPHFMAYSARNPSFGKAWRTMVMEPPRQELRHLIKLGIKKGELLSTLDLDLSLSLLLGPILYWHVFFKDTSENPRSVAEVTVDTFWRAFGLKKSKRLP